MSRNLMFKQVTAEGGCNSFIVADAISKKACIIDPRHDEHDRYAAYISSHGLKVEMVIDTHTHADHYSGTHLVAKEFGAKIAMSSETKSARADLKLKDGETIEISSALGIATMHTPGHTPDSISLVLKADRVTAAFTGDTLFIGGSGRTDFPGADASAQYDSIHKRLGSLADAAWVFPGHDYSGLLVSTIKHEKLSNPHWRTENREAFLKIKEAELLDSSGIITQIVDFNLNAKPMARPRAGAHTMCASGCIPKIANLPRENTQSLKALLEEGEKNGRIIIDVREPEEFARGHVEGMRNIPLSELFLYWDELNSADSVVFFCQQGMRSIVAAQSFARLGLKNLADHDGGLNAWVASGFAVTGQR